MTPEQQAAAEKIVTHPALAHGIVAVQCLPGCTPTVDLHGTYSPECLRELAELLAAVPRE